MSIYRDDERGTYVREQSDEIEVVDNAGGGS